MPLPPPDVRCCPPADIFDAITLLLKALRDAAEHAEQLIPPVRCLFARPSFAESFDAAPPALARTFVAAQILPARPTPRLFAA